MIEILKKKPHCMGPLTDTLIRNGLSSIAEALIQLQQKQRQKAVAAQPETHEPATATKHEGCNGLLKNGNGTSVGLANGEKANGGTKKKK